MNTPRRVGTGFALTFGLALALLIGPSCSLVVSTSGLADAPGATDASGDSKVATDGQGSTDAPYSSDAADGGIEFYDSFERPNSSEIGNGWIEKVLTLFVLEQGAAKQVVEPASYLGLTVFRPVAEHALDVEVRVDFISTKIHAFPRVVARLDPSLPAGSFRAYMARVVVDQKELTIGRGDGSLETTLAATKLSTDFSLGSRYRLALRVTGASLVTMDASLVDPTSGKVIARVSTTDGSDQRIQSAGSMGFAGDDELGLTYDDFAYTRW